MKRIEQENASIMPGERSEPSISEIDSVISNEIDIPEPPSDEGMPAEAWRAATARLKTAAASYKDALTERNRAMDDAAQRKLKAAERAMRVAQLVEANLRRHQGDPIEAMKALEAKKAELDTAGLSDAAMIRELASQAATFEEALEEVGAIRHDVERRFKRSF